MEIKFTKDPFYLEQWDAFVQHNDKGSHLLLSDWLRSYSSYGFDFELCLILKDAVVVGGYGAVVAKALFFKFYIVPYGPLVSDASLLPELIASIPKRATHFKTCYCQLNFPFSTDLVSTHYYNTLDETLFENFKKGNLFKFVYSSNGLLWVDFSNYDSPEALLLSYKSSVRRDIRSALRKGQEIRYLTTADELKSAYDLCLENAKTNNYSLRDWTSFSPTLFSLVEKGFAHFIAAYSNTELKGAILVVKSGNYYTYILGGTKKEKPDLLTGHLLQWEAIQLGFKEQMDGYNISLGGSEGVKAFKNNFATTTINYHDTKYYVVINPIVFKIFLFFDKKIKSQKKHIAKVLHVFKIGKN